MAGVIALAVGVLLLWQGWQVRGDLGPQGPRFLPVVLAIAWILLAAVYLAGAVARLAGRRGGVVAERLDHLPRVLALETSGSQVEFFSPPEGTVKGVGQLAARFSEPMVVFGDP